MVGAMKWERGHKSQYVEDVRGQRASGRGAALKVGGGGAAILALVALIAQAFGVNLPVPSGDSGGQAASSGGGGGGDRRGGPVDARGAGGGGGGLARGAPAVIASATVAAGGSR